MFYILQKTLLIILMTGFSCRVSELQKVKKFGVLEVSYSASGTYDNPYTEVAADAELTRPDGILWKIPLFWDGLNAWKLRVSPDMAGTWTYKIVSNDPGIDNEKGSFVCAESGLKGSIEPMAGFPYHFQYQNGKKMWFMGETAWALFNDNEEEELNRQTFEHFIRTRASQGFNSVHAMMLSEAGWGNSGGMPFTNMGNQILNPGYWKEIDSRIEFANRHGLVVGIVLAWGDKNGKVPYPWRLFPDMEARKNFTRYIAARYSAYDVYFIVSGEWHAEIRTRPGSEEEIRNEFIILGDMLNEADPHNRMIGIHPMTENGSVREFNKAGWMSFGDYQQNYARLHSRILESVIFNKPVVNSEYGYFLRDQNGDGVPDKDNSTNLESMRHASWDIVMGGGYLVTGFGTTYFGGNRDPGPFDVDAAKNDEWEKQIGFIKEFFESMTYWKLVSHDELLICKTPRADDSRHLGRLSPPSTTYWLLAETGRQYVLYVRGLNGKITFDLKKNNFGRFNIRLFNPCTGEIKTIGEAIELNSSYTWTPPDNNDWVLYFTLSTGP